MGDDGKRGVYFNTEDVNGGEDDREEECPARHRAHVRERHMGVGQHFMDNVRWRVVYMLCRNWDGMKRKVAQSLRKTKKKTVEDVERRVVLEKDGSEEKGRDDEIKEEVRLKQTFQAKAERL